MSEEEAKRLKEELAEEYERSRKARAKLQGIEEIIKDWQVIKNYSPTPEQLTDIIERIRKRLEAEW